MAQDYVTVADELREHADAALAHFRGLGYTAKVEHYDVSFPNTPTLLCKRQTTTIAVELDSAIRFDRLDDWSRYCRSCSKDTQIVLVLPSTAARKPEDEDRLRASGIGLMISADGVLTEVAQPRDLAVNVELPDRAGLHTKLRKALGPVYEHFARSQWREGFEAACVALEQEARKYLRGAVERGAVQFINENGNPRNVTPERVTKMTLGQLAVAFAQMQPKTANEQRIGEVLSQINTDRVGVAHLKGQAAPEARLRKNVGKHMWAVITALKLLKNV